MRSPNPSLQHVPVVVVAAPLLFLLSGCAVIGDIFKAGMGVGIFAVVLVIAVVGGIAALVSRRG
jgi:hypothetical protein